MKVIVDSLAAARKFKAGVSLHSHTLHSRESLGILYALRRRSPLLDVAVRLMESSFRKAAGACDLNRGWWTPPLSAHEAWQLERKQIEAIGLSPIVSLTDHDNIDAPLSLRVLDECSSVPVSVEWTVPFESTFFHVGIHDLPRRDARGWIRRFAEYTSGRTRDLAGIFDDLCASTNALAVLNHPFWDESGLGPAAHESALRRFMVRHGGFIHALEVNGLRPWTENRKALEYAKAIDRPVVSGGDRHGYEPNAVLNVTHAATFAEFAEEVRSGHSNVLFTERYREPYGVRIVRNFAEMAGYLEAHAHGWRHWSERVFYQFEDGGVRSVREVFGGTVPETLNAPFRLLGLARLRTFDRALRWAAPARDVTYD